MQVIPMIEIGFLILIEVVISTVRSGGVERRHDIQGEVGSYLQKKKLSQLGFQIFKEVIKQWR